VGFTAHPIRYYKQVQRWHDSKTIFIVSALLSDIALPATYNSHKYPFVGPSVSNEWSRRHPERAGS
jgi:hypothetical protein